MTPWFHSSPALAGALFALGLSAAPVSAATVVEVELQLLIDASGSVSPDLYDAQRRAYAQALDRISAAAGAGLVSLPSFAIQATIYSGLDQQFPLTPWRLVDDPAGLASVAAMLRANTTRPFAGQTNVADAIDHAVEQFRENDFDGARQVIDVSTDRIPNETRDASEAGTGAPTQSELSDDLFNARERALGFDGIVCIGNSSFCFPAGGGGVEQINVILFGADEATSDFYAANLVGGDDGFLLNVGPKQGATLAELFEDDLARKIVAELTQAPLAQIAPLPAAVGVAPAPVPVPAAGWLLLVGVGALAALRRR